MNFSFKEKLLKTITYSGLILSFTQPMLGVTTAFASPNNNTQQSLEDVEKDIKSIQELLNEQDVNIVELMELIQIKEEEVLVLLGSIETKENELEVLQENIDEKDIEIKNLIKEIEETKVQLESKIEEYELNIERAASRAQSLQKEEKDKTTLYIEAVFNSESLTDILNRVRSVNIIMNAHEKQINYIEEQALSIESDKEKLEVAEENLKKEQMNLKSMKENIEKEQKELFKQKKDSDKVIEELNVEKKEIQASFDGNQEELLRMQETRDGIKLYNDMIEREQQREKMREASSEQVEKDVRALSTATSSLNSALDTIRGNRRNPDLVKEVFKEAEKYLGVPYLWGGTTPSGFDCSGFIQYIFQDVGINLPRVTQQQVKAGAPVALEDAQPGDLLFWDKAGDVYHVALYIGGGEYIHAPRPGSHVKVANVKHFTPSSARRVISNVPLSESKEVKSNFKSASSQEKGDFIGTFQATAYAVGAWAVPGTVTANGTDIANTIHSPEGHNIIAVDPRIIPLNTVVHVEVPGMEPFIAKASDTGGAIKGNIIDILFGSVKEAQNFGRKDGIKIYKVN